MTGNSLYNLTWGEFGTSLISGVQLLRCHGELVDVTLAAGGRTFHAHKVVLCAASPFLLDILKSSTCKHPIVMLAGVQASDLEALLEFVYRGEVSIDPDQLPSLLQAAHCLNIQGLVPVVPQQEVDKSEMQRPEDARAEHEHEIGKNKRKRTKKPLKSPQIAKYPRVFVQLESSGDNMNSGSESQLEATTQWTQHMDLVSVSPDSIPTPLLVQSIPAVQNSSNGTKIRGASDQPGTLNYYAPPSSCPLCGAMLRQARNLRRHLLTSCKYRMAGGHHHPSHTDSRPLHNSMQETQLHHLQTISVQNLDRVNPSGAGHLESKDSLTPITCTELLPTNITNL